MYLQHKKAGLIFEYFSGSAKRQADLQEIALLPRAAGAVRERRVSLVPPRHGQSYPLAEWKAAIRPAQQAFSAAYEVTMIFPVIKGWIEQ